MQPPSLVVSSGARPLLEQVVSHASIGDTASHQDMSPSARVDGSVELEEVSATASERRRERTFDELTEGLEAQRSGSGAEREDVHGARPRLADHARGEEARSLVLHQLDELACVIGQLREVTVHLGVLDAQGWQRDVPQTNALEGMVMIAWVGHRDQGVTSIPRGLVCALPARRQEGVHVGARAVDERPHDGVLSRGGDAAQAAHAAAAQEPREHRLGLVVARVPHGHHVGAELAPQHFERLVAGLAGSRRRPGTGRERELQPTERDTPAIRQGRHVRHFASGLGTQSMIDGRDGDLQREGGREPHQHVGQHDGVGPPRAAHQDVCARAKEATAQDGRADGGDQRCQRSASRLRRRR